jgi:arylsulfatase A-like enzyme
VVRWTAGGIAGGRTDDGLVSLTDLAPTLLAAAGLPAPASMDDGLDLLPQWRGERRVRDRVVVEYLDDPRVLCTATVVTDSWKATQYLGGAYGPAGSVGELYDTAGGEVRNLWDDPTARKAKREHLELLERDVPRLRDWRTPARVGAV